LAFLAFAASFLAFEASSYIFFLWAALFNRVRNP
jgi:hypothetical protein